MKIIRLSIIAFLCMSAGPLLPAQQTAADSQQRQKLDLPKAPTLEMWRDFAPGGTLLLDVNVGEVDIVPSPDDHALRLVIQPDRQHSQNELQDMVKQFDVRGGAASIRLKLPHKDHNGAKVTIYVPTETAMTASLDAGELKIGAVRGDKRLHVGVGELNISQMVAADYYKMEANCGIGDVSDSVFNSRQSGWLGKSAKTSGPGKYSLKAHVGVGEVVFSQDAARL